MKRPALRLPILLAATALALAGCAQPQPKTLAIEERIAEVDSKPPAPVAVPEAVQQALLSGESAPAAEEQERFDVSVNNVSARAFFLSLADGTRDNIVVHPDLNGQISLTLSDVTVPQVLDVTRDIYGYEYRYRDGIYTVYPNALRTEVFHINYLDVQRVGVSDTSVMIGRGESGSRSRNSGNNNNNSGTSENANLLGMLEGFEGGSGTGLAPGSRVQTLNRTDFWRSLNQTIEAIIGGSDGDRMVMVSPQAGMVAVKAMPSELNAVRDFLERSELSVKRQVILEAKILEVQLNDNYQAGINWGEINGMLQYQFQQGTDTNYSRQLDYSVPLPGEATGFRSLSEGLAQGTGELFSSVLQVGNITELISLLQTQGNVQVLSSPRVSTVNNQKAVIRVGSDEYFVTGISNNTTANASSVTSTPNIELSPFFSGISLDVTPQIAEDESVILHIHPVVSEVTDQLKVFTVGSEDFALPLALRGVRESDSIVRAKNGQVIVLGGLMQERITSQDGKHPGFGHIPILGALFRQTQRINEKTELVILLRPVVVTDQAWTEALEESRLNIRGIGDAHRQMID